MRKHIAESAKSLKRDIRELDRLIKLESEKMERVRKTFISKVRQEIDSENDSSLKTMSDNEIIDLFLREQTKDNT